MQQRSATKTLFKSGEVASPRRGGGGGVQKLPRFPCYLSDPSGENFCKESLLQQLGGALVENLSKERLLQRLVEHW